MSSVGMNALVPELADLDARQVERRPENGELKIVNQIFRQSGWYAGDGIGSACHERGSDETGHPDLHMVLVQLASQDLLEYLMHGMPVFEKVTMMWRSRRKASGSDRFRIRGWPLRTTLT